jgi:ketosteroid isomerase-like protein
LWQNIEPVSAQIHHTLVANNFAVVIGEFSARMLPTGKVYDSIFSAYFTIEDNLIVRYRLREDSYGLEKALS